MCKNDFFSQKPYNESKLSNMGSDKYFCCINICRVEKQKITSQRDSARMRDAMRDFTI